MLREEVTALCALSILCAAAMSIAEGRSWERLLRMICLSALIVSFFSSVCSISDFDRLQAFSADSIECPYTSTEEIIEAAVSNTVSEIIINQSGLDQNAAVVTDVHIMNQEFIEIERVSIRLGPDSGRLFPDLKNGIINLLGIETEVKIE